MDCNWLTTNLGFECREVKTILHEPALAVETPFSFVDGEAIGFYVVEHGGSIRVTDNGDTIAHLINVGLNYQDKRRWAALRNKADAHGLTLTDDGELCAVGGASISEHLVGQYLTAVLSIVEYEREALSAPVDLHIFAEEVEMLLRAWKPGSKVIRNAKVQGQSSRVHTFDFKVDKLLVDAINPHASSSGALLRKAGDIKSGPEAEFYDVMAIIDDRHDSAAAKMEKDIISSMVKATLYTKLESKLQANHGVSNH